jgi:peroxiredoxin
MRSDLVPGNPFPDLRLPEHIGAPRKLSLIADDQPLVLAFVRGWWCPKEQIRLRNLLAMQDEIQREYGRIAVVTIDAPYVNGAFRAGLGADFPFLSAEDRAVAEELDIIELTDEKHSPYLPLTFILDSPMIIRRSWNGFWYWGNPDHRPRAAPCRTGGIEPPDGSPGRPVRAARMATHAHVSGPWPPNRRLGLQEVHELRSPG